MRCSELSLELDEPLVATAPVAARWELVDQPKPWGRAHGLEVPGAKVLLVQRVSGSEPQSSDQRKYLVCTNGARDPCCAIRGAAVARALAEARPGCAYESSHLGGHRFAANLLVLPLGLCFGRLDVRTALALVDELDAGRLPLEHFRGRSSFTAEQQAAEILVRRELDLSGLDDLQLEDGLSGSEPQSQATTFRTRDGGRVTAVVHGRPLPPRRVSCRDDKLEAPMEWTLSDLVAQSH
jgi:hypothetical protein